MAKTMKSQHRERQREVREQYPQVIQDRQQLPQQQDIQDVPTIQCADSSAHALDERGLVLQSLSLMLERLVLYFQERALQDDRETLAFCLRHLFSHVDELYCQTLPTLATLTHTRSTSIPSFYAPSLPMTRLQFRYALWTHLQAMQQDIERIESLCHLLNRTVPRLLAVLDMPGETLHHTDTVLHVRGENGSGMAQIHDIQNMQNIQDEDWQRVYDLLTTRLSAWQEQNGERLTLVNDTPFQTEEEILRSAAHIVPPVVATNTMHSVLHPLLVKIDAALMLILDSASAIFGDIIPDFQVVSAGDDEVVATLLFDLMQQADLLLIQCDAIFTPLQDLIRHYVLLD